MFTTEQAASWRGQQLTSPDGDKIGTIEEIYLDGETERPEWATVQTGLFGSKRSFVPLRDAAPSGDRLSVPFDKSLVKAAPTVDPDGELTRREEADLYRHYGMEYSDARSSTGLPEGGAGDTPTAQERGAPGQVGRDVSGPTTDDAMTRSEEELRVGTAERESGRVRLRKYVVEDEVTQTVPVQREEVRLEREPITDANVDAALDGPAISEEEHEVVLHEEEPVTEKRAVPKERVRLDKDVHTEQREVGGTVRKEQIDVDDDAGRV